MSKRIRGLAVLCLALILFAGCNPDAHWETSNVDISMSVQTVSAGYIECSFSTSKDAYYLVSCVPVEEGYDPMTHQKQFMTLALDSANVEYINWRYLLLKEGVTPIAPFASHALQYGKVDYFFTNLTPGTDYWVYAFVVNPETLKPAGKLHMMTLTTTETSVVDVRFEYRVRGLWDYIYPIYNDSINDRANYGKINSHFPYLAATRDSLEIAYWYEQEFEEPTLPELYFSDLFLGISKFNLTDHIRYGVQVVENNGVNSDIEFEEGHTYYTAIVSFDGFIGNNVIYKFKWKGENFEAYFKNEDSFIYDWFDE